jgi:hypothetical protein
MRALVLVALSGCAASIDGGVIQEPALSPKGGSITAHLGMGGGGMSTSPYMLSVGIDTRVDVASGGSRWTAGGSALGGLKLHPKFFLDARVGVWTAIVSGTQEATVVPSFELGGFVPLNERYDPKHPMHGSGVTGIVFGIREDLDEVNYTTVFVGYAIFLMPGY